MHATFKGRIARSLEVETTYANTRKFGVLKIGDPARILQEEVNLARLGRQYVFGASSQLLCRSL